MTGIDHLVKVTLVEDQNKALLNYAKLQRQLRSSNENRKPVNRICCMALFRLGEHLVSWGAGLQRRFGYLAEVSV